MPSRDTRTYFNDILESLDRIERFVVSMDFASYQLDDKTRSAVERQLQILTEAAKVLGSIAESVCPGPDWKGLRGMGDLLRHAYHRIDDELIWDTVTLELPPLRLAVEKTLASRDLE